MHRRWKRQITIRKSKNQHKTLFHVAIKQSFSVVRSRAEIERRTFPYRMPDRWRAHLTRGQQPRSSSSKCAARMQLCMESMACARRRRTCCGREGRLQHIVAKLWVTEGTDAFIKTTDRTSVLVGVGKSFSRGGGQNGWNLFFTARNQKHNFFAEFLKSSESPGPSFRRPYLF